MTNRERLISLIGFAPSKESIDGTLIDAGITGSLTYDGSNKVVLKKFAIQLLELLISTPNMTNDVGLVITYDRNAILALVKQYKVDVGEEKSTKPTLRFISL